MAGDDDHDRGLPDPDEAVEFYAGRFKRREDCTPTNLRGAEGVAAEKAAIRRDLVALRDRVEPLLAPHGTVHLPAELTHRLRAPTDSSDLLTLRALRDSLRRDLRSLGFRH